MSSSASSRDLNELSKTYSHDFQTSEQDRAAAEQQATDEHSSGHTNIDEEKGNTIPRADGGRDAWLFLAGCFVFEALIWGFPFSFRVFQSSYTTHPPFSEHSNGIVAIGTCSSGVMYLWAPVTIYILESWHSARRLSSIFGLVIVVSAMIASSFSTQVWHLILTQDEWFVKKKGLAFGIMWAGVGTSGLIFPFLLTFLLNTHGFATTLRIWALTLTILCSPLIYFIKPRPRLPPSRQQKPTCTFLLLRINFYLQTANILESLGFFLPSIYLPSYCVEVEGWNGV